MAAYTEALALRPIQLRWRNERAAMFLALGDTSRAYEDAQKSRRLDPRSVQSVLLLGAILERRGETRRAVELYRQFLEQRPERDEVRRALDRSESQWKR